MNEFQAPRLFDLEEVFGVAKFSSNWIYSSGNPECKIRLSHALRFEEHSRKQVQSPRLTSRQKMYGFGRHAAHLHIAVQIITPFARICSVCRELRFPFHPSSPCRLVKGSAKNSRFCNFNKFQTLVPPFWYLRSSSLVPSGTHFRRKNSRFSKVTYIYTLE